MAQSSLRRGVALQKTVQLRERQKALNQDIISAKKELETLNKQYQPLINQLQQKADIMAHKFRKLYRESQDAFIEGDGELAKSLSIEGREAQDECESFNDQTNRMRRELKNLQERISRRAGELNENETRIAELKVALQSMSRPRLSGFERSAIQPLNLEQFLDKLPQTAFREIEEVDFFFEQAQSIEMGDKLGETQWHLETKRATIRMYLHKPELGEREYETIVHEIGHEIFFKFFNLKEKIAWEEFYKGSGDWFVSGRAIRSAEEDFCECLAVFWGNRSSELARRDSRKYTLIKEVMERLEKDYEKT